MSQETMKAIYKAKDDSEHPTAAKAAQRNAVLDALDKFQKAQSELRQSLRKASLTKDGKPFSYSCLTDYWYVRDCYDSLPYLVKLDGPGYDAHFDIGHSGEIVVWVTDRSDGEKDRRYSVGDLYASEAEARREHIRLCHERLKEMQLRVEQIEQRYAKV